MKSFKEFSQADVDLDFSQCLISEASLSRVIRQAGKKFFIITAERGNLSAAQNKSRNRQLLADLNRNKLGPQRLIGHWQECSDDTLSYDKCPPEKLVDVEEYSFFVPIPDDWKQENYDILIAGLVKKYNQDAALVRDEDGLFLIQRNGKKVKIGAGSTTVNAIDQAYSQHVKKRDLPFVFEGLIVPATIGGKRLFKEAHLSYPHLSKQELNEAKEFSDK